jgi:hypothetical protein
MELSRRSSGGRALQRLHYMFSSPCFAASQHFALAIVTTAKTDQMCHLFLLLTTRLCIGGYHASGFFHGSHRETRLENSKGGKWRLTYFILTLSCRGGGWRKWHAPPSASLLCVVSGGHFLFRIFRGRDIILYIEQGVVLEEYPRGGYFVVTFVGYIAMTCNRCVVAGMEVNVLPPGIFPS